MSQLKARPSRMAKSIAFLFITGKVPGCAKETALMFVFGALPKEVLSPQNNLLLVNNCVCTSRPITASYFSESCMARRYEKTYPIVAIKYKEMKKLPFKAAFTNYTNG